MTHSPNWHQSPLEEGQLVFGDDGAIGPVNPVDLSFLNETGNPAPVRAYWTTFGALIGLVGPFCSPFCEPLPDPFTPEEECVVPGSVAQSYTGLTIPTRRMIHPSVRAEDAFVSPVPRRLPGSLDLSEQTKIFLEGIERGQTFSSRNEDQD